ncbi:hypothetical protein ScPMuIL_001208 [Solemya velum]
MWSSTSDSSKSSTWTGQNKPTNEIEEQDEKVAEKDWVLQKGVNPLKRKRRWLQLVLPSSVSLAKLVKFRNQDQSTEEGRHGKLVVCIKDVAKVIVRPNEACVDIHLENTKVRTITATSYESAQEWRRSIEHVMTIYDESDVYPAFLVPSLARDFSGECIVWIRSSTLTLLDGNGTTIVEWPVNVIRRYGKDGTNFLRIDLGRRCPTGVGVVVLSSIFVDQITARLADQCSLENHVLLHTSAHGDPDKTVRGNLTKDRPPSTEPSHIDRSPSTEPSHRHIGPPPLVGGVADDMNRRTWEKTDCDYEHAYRNVYDAMRQNPCNLLFEGDVNPISNRVHGYENLPPDLNKRVRENLTKDRSPSTEPNHKDRSQSMEPSHKERSQSTEPSHKELSQSTEPSHKDRSRSTEPGHKEMSQSTEPSHKDRSRSTEPSHKEMSRSTEPSHRHTGPTPLVVGVADDMNRRTWEKTDCDYEHAYRNVYDAMRQNPCNLLLEGDVNPISNCVDAYENLPPHLNLSEIVARRRLTPVHEYMNVLSS